MDFFYEPSSENAQKLFQALKDFWQGLIPGVQSPEELVSDGLIIQFGVPPNRIDLVSSITAISFSEAWKSKVEEKLEIKDKLCSVYFIGLDQLITNKEAINRFKDLEDLKYLKAASKKLKNIK